MQSNLVRVRVESSDGDITGDIFINSKEVVENKIIIIDSLSKCKTLGFEGDSIASRSAPLSWYMIRSEEYTGKIHEKMYHAVSREEARKQFYFEWKLKNKRPNIIDIVLVKNYNGLVESKEKSYIPSTRKNKSDNKDVNIHSSDYLLAKERVTDIFGDSIVITGDSNKYIQQCVIDINNFSHNILNRLKIAGLRIYIEDKLVTEMEGNHNLDDRYKLTAGLYKKRTKQIYANALDTSIYTTEYVAGHEIGHAISDLFINKIQTDYFKKILFFNWRYLYYFQGYEGRTKPGEIVGAGSVQELIADIISVIAAQGNLDIDTFKYLPVSVKDEITYIVKQWELI
jgi:hypothetical protein